MTILEQTEKMEYLNYLIKNKCTGSAKNLSKKLDVSIQSIYRLLDTMRNMGCPIEYSKALNSYFYKTPGDICLKFQEES